MVRAKLGPPIDRWTKELGLRWMGDLARVSEMGQIEVRMESLGGPFFVSPNTHRVNVGDGISESEVLVIGTVSGQPIKVIQ